MQLISSVKMMYYYRVVILVAYVDFQILFGTRKAKETNQ